LNGIRVPATATTASAMAAMSSASLSPASWAITPNTALPSAPPPWKITR
jgi:hypothetical protein